GHSLLATQVMARLTQVLGVSLSLRMLFEAPTIRELAARIEQELRLERGVPLPVLQPVPRTQQLPPSYAQQRLWFLDQLEPGSSIYNVPSAVKLRGMLS